MQLVINIQKEQDLQLLLQLLERLQIAYKPLTVPKRKKEAALNSKAPAVAPAPTLSQKYAGKLSAATGAALQIHVTESRKPQTVPQKQNRLQMVAHMKGVLPNLPYSKYDVYEQ